MTAALLLIVSLAGAPAAPVQDQRPDPQADLLAARTLYASAAYEDALDRLNRIRDVAEYRDQVDTYKALCLLALERTRESERVVEQILARNPRYVLDELSVSPRLIVIYRAVRARMLPPAARTLFASARANYEDHKFDIAASQLRELIGMLDSTDGDPVLADLKAQAEEFQRVLDAESKKPADAPQVTAPGDVQMALTPVAPSKGPIYSSVDRGVSAPVEITRPMPIWTAPRGMQPALYQGLIEVVIDEAGRVESAVVRRSIAPSFDAELVNATRLWRFQAATRNGAPVKYRRTYEIIGHSR